MAARWREELKDAVTRVDALLAAVGLSPADLPDPPDPDPRPGLLVPRPYVRLMRPGDPGDPLLRQVLPLRREAEPCAGYCDDPLCEREASPTPGLLHKYRGRALLLAASGCGVRCRFCFRRHDAFAPRPAGTLGRAMHHLAEDRTVSEVILSGGDPLTLSDNKLLELNNKLATLPHLRRLRVHTRLPVALPSRLTGGLAHALSATRLCPVLVLHINHPNELSPDLAAGLAPLRRRGVTLLCQSVLLAGVNDNPDTLAQLAEALLPPGILPYYLHQLDRVSGAAHFAVPDARARAIHNNLRTRLPGYLLPRLVRELPGKPAKHPL